jgi:hypothetical protein
VNVINITNYLIKSKDTYLNPKAEKLGIKEQFKEGSKNAESHDIEGEPHYKSNETTLMKI